MPRFVDLPAAFTLGGTAKAHAAFSAAGRKKDCVIKLEEIEKISSIYTPPSPEPQLPSGSWGFFVLSRSHLSGWIGIHAFQQFRNLHNSRKS